MPATRHIYLHLNKSIRLSNEYKQSRNPCDFIDHFLKAASSCDGHGLAILLKWFCKNTGGTFLQSKLPACISIIEVKIIHRKAKIDPALTSTLRFMMERNAESDFNSWEEEVL